jgi:hypothetical protein
MNANEREYSFQKLRNISAAQPEELTRRSEGPKFYYFSTFGASGLRVKNACGAFIRVHSCPFVGALSKGSFL